METDDPKVAAIWVAWLMTEKASDTGFQENTSATEKAAILRVIFTQNYQAIHAATKSSKSQDKAANSVKG